MNKRIFILVVVLLVLVTIFTLKFDLSSKKELKDVVSDYYSTKEKVNRIIYLKNKYVEKKVPFCSKVDNLIICENLNKSKFKTINRKIFKQDFPIKGFEIVKKSSNIDIKVKVK